MSSQRLGEMIYKMRTSDINLPSLRSENTKNETDRSERLSKNNRENNPVSVSGTWLIPLVVIGCEVGCRIFSNSGG